MKREDAMSTKAPLAAPMLAATLLAMSACADRAGREAVNAQTSSATVPAVAVSTDRGPTAQASGDAAARGATGLPAMVVHKSPTCGCCGSWVEHMREAGFSVEVRDEDDLAAIKEALGVPDRKSACHTAEVGGYFIEGHVPAEDVKRLLADKLDAKGLALPGMPAGSPGMEMPDGRVEAYTVELVAKDGGTTPFARH